MTTRFHRVHPAWDPAGQWRREKRHLEDSEDREGRSPRSAAVFQPQVLINSRHR